MNRHHTIDGLREAAAAGRRLVGASFQGLDATGQDLSGLRLDSSKMRWLGLADSTLASSRLTACTLVEMSLDSCDVRDAVWRMCTIERTSAVGLAGRGARLEDSKVLQCDLRDADIRGSALSETDLTGTSLRRALLDDVTAYGAMFRRTDLRAATLVDATLTDADLRGSDLTGACLQGANLRGVDFRGARLDDVDWEGADTTGARFDDGARPTVSDVRDAGQQDQAARPSLLADVDVLDVLRALDRPDAPVELQELTAALRDGLASGALTLQLDEVIGPVLAVLDGHDEPPESWQPWLSPLMRNESSP